ncbi:MAG: autotransporter outer membrane beta-barrel domain-containing protein [Alphaproteobacteria bacterium]|nr:autotransporter outer membrane beta-barrel domain-containing protein [Alphaproteobacteria bacterium]
MAVMALPTAALAQSDGMVDNIMRNVAGLYSLKVRPTNNAWADTDYIGANSNDLVDVESEVWGFEAGTDFQSDTYNKLGAFVSYRHGTHDISGEGEQYYSPDASEIEIDSYLAGLYYYHHKNNLYTFASVYGGVQKADITTDDAFKLSTDGVEFGANLEIGYTIGFENDFVLTPSLGVSYKHIAYDDAKDDIAGKEFEFADISQVQAEAGLKFSQAYENSAGFGEIYVKPSVIQTFNTGDDVKVSELGEVEAIDDMTLGRIEVGAQHNITSNFAINAWGNYTVGSDYDSTAMGLGVKYNW